MYRNQKKFKTTMFRCRLDKQLVAAQEDDPGKLVRRCGTRHAMQVKRRRCAALHYALIRHEVQDPNCNAAGGANLRCSPPPPTPHPPIVHWSGNGGPDLQCSWRGDAERLAIVHLSGSAEPTCTLGVEYCSCAATILCSLMVEQVFGLSLKDYGPRGRMSLYPTG